MESNKTTPSNPNAFPMYNELGNLHDEGMTLRDYFAAKAMQSIIQAKLINGGKDFVIGADNEVTNLIVSKVSYTMADAMLKIREL